MLAASALRLSKVAVAYRDGQLLRSFHTMGHPTAVAWVPSPGGGGGPLGRLLAVAEESRVTLWDVRQVGGAHARVGRRDKAAWGRGGKWRCGMCGR